MNTETLNQGLLFGPEPKDGPKWGLQRRLEFIDYRLTWDRVLNRSDLRDFFGISVPQASLDIAEYIKRAPFNLEYDTKTKSYKATDQFNSIYPSSSLSNYLDDLLRLAVSDIPYESFLGWIPAVTCVPRPSRRLSSEVVLAVTMAIRHNYKITIKYQSFTEYDPIIRTISPHTLVHDGFRWHTRAYCHQRMEFRDFVLSRIHEVLGKEQDESRIKEDKDWNTQVCLEFAAHPLLEPNQKKIIEMDYDMNDGVHKMECRQALIFYVLKQLGLEKDHSSVLPQSQQIILKNTEEIRDSLPKNAFR